MNELFDKLILRTIFTLFFCLMLFFYKHIHCLMYPGFRNELLQKLEPAQNTANTIHIFSKILGLGIIFSSFNIDLSGGIVLALTDLTIKTALALIFYTLFIYVMESIVVYAMEYREEIIEHKNISYAIISLGHSLGIAFLIKNILFTSQNSIVMFFFLWLFSMVALGLSTKAFPLMSYFGFRKMFHKKNLSGAFSYMGFVLGWSILIGSSLNHSIYDIKSYALQVVLKILLSLVILPVFLKGIVWLWRFKKSSNKNKTEAEGDDSLGYGIYEGVSFFTGCLLTIVITGKINFGTFYPLL